MVAANNIKRYFMVMQFKQIYDCIPFQIDIVNGFALL